MLPSYEAGTDGFTLHGKPPSSLSLTVATNYACPSFKRLTLTDSRSYEVADMCNGRVDLHKYLFSWQVVYWCRAGF